MKQVLITMAVIAAFPLLAAAQDGKKIETNYSVPIQVDSSEYFMIPKLVGDDTKDDYGKGKGFLPWGNYSEIYFYNAKTRQTKKLFNGQRTLIVPLQPRRSYYDREPEAPSPILPHHIIYLARTDDYNSDGGLDSADPLYLFISSKTGEGLRSITPKGFHVISWTLSHDKKMILVKGMHDKNGNKKFGNGDDESYYRIDLDEDISKIQCLPVNL
ncbi:MAG: hypothetical protein JNN00_04680 [Chitinophagaceae bacterium]|nr:hypothetical protein [Chitinophagaceae bacterium]